MRRDRRLDWHEAIDKAESTYRAESFGEFWTRSVDPGVAWVHRHSTSAGPYQQRTT
ncbi:hypothetical protein [Mycolicibacterium alvei]|uniref:hypothetical protein n=1 Tax=Mycolicibacterium alvei TaxID=67081 RepID=UPI0013D2992F|nr:hypothetical protein [Mycolicibacterium alvei]MCV7003609.1 hypothetical protein [Mycolicibacterium alvei]